MSNIHVNIDNLGLSELKNLLVDIRLYRDLKKQLGTRWEILYKKLENWTNTLVVEYFPLYLKIWLGKNQRRFLIKFLG